MKHRFRSVEITIFCLFSLTFAHSLYRLFRDEDSIDPAPQASIAQANIRKPANAEKKRQPSATEDAAPYQTHCSTQEERFRTRASRIRISGPYCGSPAKHPLPTHSNVTNTSTGFNATILNDSDSNQFSTDYIPLKEGENLILIEFEYPNSKNFKLNLSVDKN